MVIFVTDEGQYWNHNNPILERFTECVVVVCLNGKKVTDKYKCVVILYEPQVYLGQTDNSIMSTKFQELKKLRKELAEANGISYSPIECPSTGPCAGTCQRCDMELKYLRKELLCGRAD